MKELDKIDNIVDFELLKGKKEIEISECCDRYYKEKMNKKEFGELIDALKELHNEMN